MLAFTSFMILWNLVLDILRFDRGTCAGVFGRLFYSGAVRFGVGKIIRGLG